MDYMNNSSADDVSIEYMGDGQVALMQMDELGDMNCVVLDISNIAALQVLVDEKKPHPTL